ncbi:hypothetical protein QZH41_008119, partial [Actinostola sp. cb2023]
WNLLCDRAYIGAAIQSSYFAGMLIGSIVSGWIADRFGRKPSIFVSVGFIVYPTCIYIADDSSCTVSLHRPSLYRRIYDRARASSDALRRRWGVGSSEPAPNSTAGLLSMVYEELASRVSQRIKFPETARWLLAHDRIEEAHLILMNCGPKKNTEDLDHGALRELLEEIRKDEKLNLAQNANKKYTPLDLVRTPKLRKWTIIVCLNWFVVALVYFGFDLYTTQLPGSIYMNYFIMNLIDIPVIGVVWFTVLRFGRRIPYCIYMLIVGVCSFVILSLPEDQTAAIRALAIIGRSVVFSQFNNIYLITTELYPTVVRNTAMGLGSMTARIGAILSPFIVMVVVPKMTDDLKIYKALSLYSEVSTGDLSGVFDDLGLKLPSSEFTTDLVMELDPEDTGFFTVKAFLAKMGKAIKTIMKFDSYDENHDGFLDEPELNKFNDAEKTDSSVPEMIRYYDSDFDDKLSLKGCLVGLG